VIAAGLFGFRIDWIPDYIVSPLNLMFLFGFASSRIVAARTLPSPWLLLVGAAVAGVLVNIFDSVMPAPPMVSRLAMGIIWAVGIAAMAMIEEARSVAVPSALLRLGNASYAIYLIHFPAVMVLGKLVLRSGMAKALPAELVIAGIAVIAVASAFALHFVVERPIATWLRRAVPTHGARAPLQNTA
jgi:peptidoglycan/LPS O-acetylase OafA/YrhL